MIIIELEWLDMGNYHLSWFKSYLTSKKQFVNIYDIFPVYPIYHRMSSNVFTQVPSYSILFINFIVKDLYYTTFLLFTDDIKIYSKIDSTPNCNFFSLNSTCSGKEFIVLTGLLILTNANILCLFSKHITHSYFLMVHYLSVFLVLRVLDFTILSL